MPYNPQCLRCHTPMNFLRTADLLTRTKEPLLQHIGYVYNRDVAAFRTDIYCCPDCGHLEFFRHDADGSEDPGPDQLAQIKCPKCGQLHDIDCPKCPFCGREAT